MPAISRAAVKQKTPVIIQASCGVANYVGHKNLDGFTVRLYQAKKLVKEQHYSVLRPKDYRAKDTVFTFKAPDLGTYVMRIIPDIRAKRDSESKFNVTRFKVLTCRLPENQYEVVTLDGQTGHPIPNAKVTLYSREGVARVYDR